VATADLGPTDRDAEIAMFAELDTRIGASDQDTAALIRFADAVRAAIRHNAPSRDDRFQPLVPGLVPAKGI
jgi:hypothetical protein